MQPEFIHRFIPAEDKEEQWTLLLLHGTGGSEEDLISPGQFILPGAAVLSPRGKVLEDGSPRFFRRLAEGVFDLEDLRFRAYELMAFIKAAAAEYGFYQDKVVAVGYSNGANMAAAIMLLGPEALAGAILFRPTVPLVPDMLPDLRGKPIFISKGEHDEITDPADTENLAALFEQCGAQVTIHREDAGHELRDGDIIAAREWIKQAHLIKV